MAAALSAASCWYTRNSTGQRLPAAVVSEMPRNAMKGTPAWSAASIEAVVC
ncbi:MAG: hypothetical protein ACYDHH_30230 [Solirubrobacteraceae bacterium]